MSEWVYNEYPALSSAHTPECVMLGGYLVSRARVSCRPGFVVSQAEDPSTDTWNLLPLGPSIHRPVKGARGEMATVDRALPGGCPGSASSPLGRATSRPDGHLNRL